MIKIIENNLYNWHFKIIYENIKCKISNSINHLNNKINK